MKIVDARSGEVMWPGKTLVRDEGEKIRVIDLDERGLFRARALVERTSRDVTRSGAPVVTQRWVPLSVRFMHPSYLFERVAVLPI